MHSTRKAIVLPLIAIMCWGCTHQLRVTNLDEYAVAFTLGGNASRPPRVAITPFSGTPDALFFFNAVVARLNADPGMGELRTDYHAGLAKRRNAFKPDVILSITPTVTYRSSGWNFLINWPGFLIFTPAWHGYVYRADVMTSMRIYDRDGTPIDEFQVPMTYNIRHADMNRTIWTGLTWLDGVGGLAFLGGIYNAFVFDRDTIAPMRVQMKGNYAEWVIATAQKRIRSVAADIAPDPDSPTAVEDVFMSPGAEPKSTTPPIGSQKP